VSKIQLSPFWPAPTAHQDYWERHHCPNTLQYDSADDGPEVETIARIKDAYPLTWDSAINRAGMQITRGAADWLFTTIAAMLIEEGQIHILTEENQR
jgi:hypothetical protein